MADQTEFNNRTQQGKVMDKLSKDEVLKCIRAFGVHEGSRVEQNITEAFNKAEKYDVMVEAGPEKYQYLSTTKQWIECNKSIYESDKKSGAYETRVLYALPSQEKCDG